MWWFSPVSLTLVGPERPLLAVVGQDLVLPCSFHPSDDTQQLTVVWYRISGNTQTHIHVHSDGTNHNEDQSHDYRGRTSLFLNEISTGNVSLKLSGIRLSDVGRYQCTVVTRDRNHDNADMEVQVKGERLKIVRFLVSCPPSSLSNSNEGKKSKVSQLTGKKIIKKGL